MILNLYAFYLIMFYHYNLCNHVQKFIELSYNLSMRKSYIT